jgi:hypothetical protein
MLNKHENPSDTSKSKRQNLKQVYPSLSGGGGVFLSLSGGVYPSLSGGYASLLCGYG